MECERTPADKTHLRLMLFKSHLCFVVWDGHGSKLSDVQLVGAVTEGHTLGTGF